MNREQNGISLLQIAALAIVLSLIGIYCGTAYQNMPRYNFCRTRQVEVSTNRPVVTADFLQMSVDAPNVEETPFSFLDNAEYVGEYDCAAYCCEKYNHICGGTGITASGYTQESGITAGANFDALPAGTWIYIDGVGIRQVQDTGPDCPMNHIDVAVETHEEALAWKLQGIHSVWILEVGNV